MSDINLILYRDGKTYDISELVESIKWKGRKGSAARSVSYFAFGLQRRTKRNRCHKMSSIDFQL